MARSDVAALILAAGEASRFRAAAGEAGPVTKLVARHRDKALVRHVAETALAARLAPVIVVTGHACDAVERELAGLPLSIAHNPDYATGMASSLKAGLAALPAQTRAAVVLLGDMPLVTPELVARLAAAFDAHPDAAAVAPLHRGERGNPVLLSAALFPDLLRLNGDAGARQVLRGRPDVVEIEVDDASSRIDVDTPDALRGLDL